MLQHIYIYIYMCVCVFYTGPITVALRSEALNVFARSNAVLVGSNPTQNMDVVLCAFVLCLCCSVSR
jgi:hypothetical protein